MQGRCCRRGCFPISPQSANGVADRLRQLTERQTEILWLVAEGLSNKEVALRLQLQEKTVKHHITGVLSKLNVRNRTEAALTVREFRDRERTPREGGAKGFETHNAQIASTALTPKLSDCLSSCGDACEIGINCGAISVVLFD